MCIYMYMHTRVFFFKYFSGGQTNISRNRGGRRLQPKYIKLAKAQGRQDHFQGGGGGGGGVEGL